MPNVRPPEQGFKMRHLVSSHVDVYRFSHEDKVGAAGLPEVHLHSRIIWSDTEMYRYEK